MADTPLVIHTRLPELFRRVRESPIDVRAYIMQGEALNLQVRGSTGVTVSVAYRLLLPDGTITYGIDSIVASSDRSLSTLSIPMPECILIGVIVDVGNGNIGRGEVYASLHVRRAPAAVAPGFEFLCQGYVDGTYRLTWPEGQHEGSLSGIGRPRSILGTDPAAGVEISETVPTNAIWRFKSLAAQLVTDVTVANRNLRLIVDDGVNRLQSVLQGTNITASLTTPVTWATGIFPQVVAGVIAQLDIGADILLPGGSRIRTSTLGLQAGDNWGAPQLLVEEWIVEQ